MLMTVKKTIEDMVLIFKENGLSDKLITSILIRLGFSEERVKHIMLKLSLLEKISSNKTEPATINSYLLCAENYEAILTEKINELNNILKKNTILLEQLLSTITGKIYSNTSKK